MRKRGGTEKGGGGGRREERKRKDLENVLPSSRTQNVYISLSSSCLCHFPSCPFHPFPNTLSCPHHPDSWHLDFSDLVLPPAEVPLCVFLPSAGFLPPSPFHPAVEHTRMHSIHTNTQLSWLLSGTFQWWTLQTFSTARWNVDIKTGRSSPAMLINRKQALFKVGILVMMPEERLGSSC